MISAQFRCIVACGISVALGGCTALNTSHYAWPGPGRSKVVSVDAKLRNTVIFDRGEGDYRFCSEDGPAAMSAGSFSLAGMLGMTPSERDINMSQASGETVASLRHTQTVNLLHKSLYRTCELWASGALDKGDFYALAARTHRSMVAVLAVEQMTGVVLPDSTIISGPAMSAAVSQSEELIELLKGYKDERVASKSSYDAALKAYDDAAKVDVTTGGETKKACSLPAEPPEDAAKPAYQACLTAKAARDEAKASYETAAKREDKILDQLAALSAGLGAATETGEIDEGGLDYDRQKISDVKMALIADSVEKIALTAGIDEALMFCMTYLRPAKGISLADDDSTKAMCNAVVLLRATQDMAVTARLAGAQSVDAAEILSAMNDPQVVAPARVMAARYEVFRTNMKLLLNATTEEQWPDRWKAFAQATGAPSVECTSLADCREYMSREDSRPFFPYYRRRADDFDKAISDWRNAIAARPDDDENTGGQS